MFSSLASLMWMQWGTHLRKLTLLILNFQLPQNLLCVWLEIFRYSMLSDPIWRMWPFHQTRRQSIAPSQDWTHDHLSAQQLPVNVRVRTFNYSASFLLQTASSQACQSSTEALCLLSAPDCIIAGLPIKYWCNWLCFVSLQIQPFNVPSTGFFLSQDCVGWFSTAIWMGLVPVGINLIILFFGMYMMSTLSTNDRFDDPKGKSLTINAGE